MVEGSQSVDDGRRSAATQIFVEPALLDTDGVIVVDSDTAHHLQRVLRLRDGERVCVADGAGRWRIAAVTGSASAARGDGVAREDGRANSGFRLEPLDDVQVAPRQRPPMVLATAIPKGERVEWLVQKAVELGVDTIQLLHAQRSVVRWKPDRASKQVDRLGRIALEASRQSRRIWLPEVRAPVEARSVLPAFAVAEPGGRSVAAGDNSVAIGPEGGWSEDELEMAADQVDLGFNVLRTETAALAAVTLYVTKS